MMDTDVCIVGGGPGGCAAALQLAKHGVRTLLVEKEVFPRDKVCGDALSGKVMRALDRLDPALTLAVNLSARRLPSWGVTFVAPSGRALRVPFSRETGLGEAPGAILPRLDFDAVLFDAVKRNTHVDVVEGAQARSYVRSSSGWGISLSAATNDHQPTTVNCKLVLAADGANSYFARHVAGLPMEPRHHAAGVRAYYRGIQGLDAHGFIELHFLKQLLPGYLWIFPLPDGKANVGLGLRSDVVRDRKVDLKAELQRLITTHPTLRDRFANATLEGPIQGMGLPLASKRHPLSGDGYMLIGDAGHLIDPFTGEGISHAMISGAYAADMATEALRAERPDADFLKSYDQRVWRRLGQELAISTRLQRLAHKAWLFDLVVDRANKNPALADTISSMFTDMDLRARLKTPGFYLDLALGRARR
ncbi:MAG: NAD(P)/FAD-dependent oxidoreductase [Flavobacteriales bacterium]|nr:NAD(P)/FAD-dependent oxidoreductase [Flavobacteriales bacterium]